MATQGYVDGTSGSDIALLVDGVKIAALQNLSWKASQSKSPIHGAGHRKPHAMGRGIKEYELDFEVKELNMPVLEPIVNAARSETVKSTSFRIGDVEFTDLLDLRDLTILVLYPEKNGFQREMKFTGFEFTDNEGSFAFDEEAVGRKLSGVALDGEGLV